MQISAENSTFSTDGKMLLSKDGKTLLQKCCASLSEYTVPDTVTTIAEGVFFECGYNKLTIPASVTTIEKDALRRANVDTLCISEDNANYSTDGKALYNKDMTELICFCGKSAEGFNIPKTVTKIANNAFENVTGFSTLTIPQSVDTIGEGCFRNTWSRVVCLEDGVKSIGDYAFASCSNLQIVRIPASVTSIGANAFSGEHWDAWDIYYAGTEAEWNAKFANVKLNNATVHFESDFDLATITPTSIVVENPAVYYLSDEPYQRVYRTAPKYTITFADGHTVSGFDSEIKAATGVVPEIDYYSEEMKRPGEFQVNVYFDDVSTVMTVPVIPVPYTDLTISGDDALVATLTCKDGSKKTLTFADSVQRYLGPGKGGGDVWCFFGTLLADDGTAYPIEFTRSDLSTGTIHVNFMGLTSNDIPCIEWSERIFADKITKAWTIEKMSVKISPQKLLYQVGESIDTTGGLLFMDIEEDDGVLGITPDMISGFDSNRIGKQTLTVTVGHATTSFEVEVLPALKMLNGKNQTAVIGSGEKLFFRSEAPLGEFQKVLVDNKVVDRANYDLLEGSTIVALHADYLATLPAGDHTIAIVSDSGIATTDFAVSKIAPKDMNNYVPNVSPKTGDAGIAVFAALAIVTLAGICIVAKKRTEA